MAGPRLTFEQQQQREIFFTRVVHQHATLLYRVAFSVLRHPADAEDAVSEALLKLVRTGAWQTITNERAFLSRSVWRSALDRLAQRDPAGPLDVQELPLENRQPNPEDHAQQAERLTLLHLWIDTLPLSLREPLLLSAVKELNSREIAEVLHLPEGTVRTRLMRARAQLREQFEAHQRTGQDHEVTAQGPSR